MEPHRCINCDNDMIRIKRDSLMKILPKSKHLYCENCHQRYLKFWVVNFKLARRNIHIINPAEVDPQQQVTIHFDQTSLNDE